MACGDGGRVVVGRFVRLESAALLDPIPPLPLVLPLMADIVRARSCGPARMPACTDTRCGGKGSTLLVAVVAAERIEAPETDIRRPPFLLYPLFPLVDCDANG